MQVFLTSAALVLTVAVCATQRVDISCSHPPDIKSAEITDISDEGYSLGTIVTYACQFGYASKGESRTLQCVESDNGEVVKWTQPEFSCHPQSCGDPGYIQNGRRVGSLFTFPNSVKYECDAGYKLIGISARYCQTSGSWSGRLPRCEVFTCDPPKDIENGHVTYNSLEYGSELRYKCDKGFHLNTEDTVFCTAEGRWSNTDVRCTESACNIPLEPEYGSMQMGGNNGSPREGSIVIFSCHGDRIPDGPVTSKCLENGQWTFPTPKCLEPCSIPYVNEGDIGKYEKESYYSRRTVFKKAQIGRRVEDNEALTIRCNEGYEVVGGAAREEKITCTRGKWSLEPHCIPAFCRNAPPAGENSEVVSLIPEHGGRVSYSCFTDYRKIKNETVFCDFGRWKGNPPNCKSTSCSVDALEFPGLLKGRIPFYRDGEIFEIACESRYQVANPGLLRCEDGTWKGPLPPCTAASCKTSPPSINLARAEVSSMTHGSLVKYVCEDPYVLAGASPVQCLFGEWKGQLPRCEDSRCYLKDLQRSSHVSPETPYVTISGSQLYVICKEGYSPRSEVPFCQNGKWIRDSVSPCQESDCSVPQINRGEIIEEKYGDYYFSFKVFRYVREVMYETVPSGRIVSPRTSYILNCRNGYSFQGTSIGRRGITCIEGKWFPDPVCLRVGTRYVPTTTTRRPPVFIPTQRIPAATSQRVTVTVAATTSPVAPTTTLEPTIEVKPDEGMATTDSGPEVEKCVCVFSVNDDNVVASVDGKRLHFRDGVPDGSTVFFRCQHVGFHRFDGPRENRCENCGHWHTNEFPTCTDPVAGNAVILFENNLNISAEGNLEARRGQNVKFRCIAIESAVHPYWFPPTDKGINVTQERRERKKYGDILYISHLEIEQVDFEHEGPYECAVGDNAVTVVNLIVIDPNVLCPAFQEEDGISVTYEMGRHVKSKASFFCTEPGKELNGKATLTCSGNGQWSDPPPVCQDIKCEELKETDLLQIFYTQDRKIGSRANFHCFVPGKRSGVSFTTCLENGLWADPTPTCKSPPCNVQDLFSGLSPNVVPDMDEVTNSTLPYGTTIRMTCGEDFIVLGYPVAKCQKDGTWEVQDIQCISGCPPPEKPPESKLIVKPEKDVYKFGETASFSCPPGLYLNTDSQLIMCLKNGWSDSILPECKEGEEYEYEAETQIPEEGAFS